MSYPKTTSKTERREKILAAIEQLRKTGDQLSLEFAASLEADLHNNDTVLGWWAGK